MALLDGTAAAEPAGLLAVDRARETWWVRPGGVTALAVREGDVLEVLDPSGAHVAEITGLGPSGREDPDVLGVVPDAPATVLRGLARDAAFLAALAPAADPGDARCLRLEHPAARLVVHRDGTVLVAAPGPAAGVVPQLPGALVVEVVRATPHVLAPGEPPPALAPEPRLDFVVPAATAVAYEVFAGEHVQVIDLHGRQCSDFLAFHAGKLGEGREAGLDATTTRTLTGAGFPVPGRRSKVFDPDMTPLVEVVQDTVGRHDAFALACTARYYEDLGYPGHANCSDNFNAALADRPQIAPRRGWPALNLFYNTAFDADCLLVGDEPWSRAGDHVLLRACTDLVCASSACPDDVDPSNGWEVTDVHVRVYAPQDRFAVAFSRRREPDADATLTRETAFGPRVAAASGHLTEHGGFWLAERFDGHGPQAEWTACRERVAMMDLTPLRKWEVLGPDAEALLQWCTTRDVRRLAVGQVTYTALCHETGGVLDDATLLRLGEDGFRLVGGRDLDGPWLAEQAAARGLTRVHVKPAGDALHNLAVQGPRSREVLAELVWTPPTQPSLRELRWFRFLVGRIGGYEGIPVVVSRTGYTGELGYEVWCHPRDGVAVWDAVAGAGAAHGIVPLGLEALELLRVEAGLVLGGHEFDDDVDPFEAGIGFVVALDGPDFCGRDALLERAAHPRRTLVGLVLDGQEAAGHGDAVHCGRARVGVVTSGVRSPLLGAPIALARVAVAHAAPGTRLQVHLDGFRKQATATVTPIPFHDPEKRRVRA